LKIIPVFFPNRGCPHRCVFCNEYMATMKNFPESVETAVRSAYTFYHGTEECEIGLYGGTFTAIDEWKRLLERVHAVALELNVKGIRISTRPDELKDITFLHDNGVVLVEIGVQSMVQDVLDASERNHTVDDVKDAVLRLKEKNMKVSIHLMTGLPKDEKAKDIFSAFEVAKLRPDGIRIHPTLVLKNTKLEKAYRAGTYIPQSLDEAIEIVSDMLSIFKNDKISVERLGMYQDFETVRNVVAGPYHPAFGELVSAKLYRKFLLSTGAKEVHAPGTLRSQISGRNKDLEVKFEESKELFASKDGEKIGFDEWLSKYVSSLEELIR